MVHQCFAAVLASYLYNSPAAPATRFILGTSSLHLYLSLSSVWIFLSILTYLLISRTVEWSTLTALKMLLSTPLLVCSQPSSLYPSFLLLSRFRNSWKSFLMYYLPTDLLLLNLALEFVIISSLTLVLRCLLSLDGWTRRNYLQLKLSSLRGRKVGLFGDPPLPGHLLFIL